MSIDLLKQYADSINLAHMLDDDLLAKIGQQVLQGYQEDLKSNDEWLADIKKVEELAKLASAKKSTPLPNSANVKFPIITKACYEFVSRTSPEIVKDGKVVKIKIIGKDNELGKQGDKAAQGQRVADFMNYQLLFENNNWETQLDVLLMRLALIGFMCKKTYYDPIRKTNKSIICDPTELIIGSDASSLEEAPRISHILHWRLNDLVEHMNSYEGEDSIFLEKPVKALIDLHKSDTLNKCIDGIEQCTYLDLDEDGYAEPYVVTVTKNDGKVLRIVAQFDKEDICVEKDKICYIDKLNFYEDFHFLPNPSGKFQSVGFGILLLHLNESINSVLNQLIDSGQLANMKGGFMDARLKMIPTGNNNGHDPAEFKLVKVMAGVSLKDGITPIAYGEPSSVLYQLLGLLIDAAKDLSSSTEINNGTQSSQNAKTGATMALQQAGQKVFNLINKGFYRSLTKSFRNLFKLNARYLSQSLYYEVLDDKLAIKQKDFDAKKISILPVADPSLASDNQRLAEAQFVKDNISLPGIDPIKATKFILAKTGIAGIQDILADESAPKAPDPAMLKLQADIEGHAQEIHIKGAQLDLQEKELLIKGHLAEAQILQMKTNSILNIAKSESEPVKTQLQHYNLELDAISKKIDTGMDIASMLHDQGMQSADHNNQQNLQRQQIEAQSDDTNQGHAGVSSEPDISGDTGTDQGA